MTLPVASCSRMVARKENDMYFITSLHEEGNQFTARRCFGFYPRKHQAVKAIPENCDDLHGDTFTHLVIEKYTSGVYPSSQDIAWYRFDSSSSQWVCCARPESAKNYIQFSLG
jgi:hypothetical protein